MRIHLAVAEEQVEVEGFYVSIALSCIRMARNEIGERPFARSHDSVDRIDVGYSCEGSRTWPDQIVNLRDCERSNTVDRRGGLCVSRIVLRLFHRRFIGF